MVKLIIDEPGHFIDLAGVSVNTPAVIDVSRISMNLVLSKLKSQGIIKYRIESGSDKPKNIKTESTQPVSKVTQSIDITKLELLLEKFGKDGNERLERLESILLSKDKNVEFILSDKKKEEEYETDGFIPTINTDSLSVRGSVGTNIIKRDDITESVESLSEFKKGSKF